jgi:hypothetical protein
MPRLTPAPAPLRRSRPRHFRRPLSLAERPAPQPALPDDTLNLGPQAVVGALFHPPHPRVPRTEEDERTGVTLPPQRFPSRTHGRSGRRLAPPEREFLALLGIALGLGVGALLLGRFSLADLLLAGAVLLSSLGLFALGYSTRQQKPADE